jgi:hypothetical protein
MLTTLVEMTTGDDRNVLMAEPPRGRTLAATSAGAVTSLSVITALFYEDI